MDHVLDNPVWNALISGNKSLAIGSETVKYFPGDVAPFVGFNENTSENFDILHRLIENDRNCAIISTKEIMIPASWRIIERFNVLQMICTNSSAKPFHNKNIVPLGYQNIEEMIELTKLTHPGPFKSGTIGFGHYEGIFNNSKLVAMAGQRLRPNQYVEISAVCTHPDFLKKGMASQLIMNQVYRIRSSSEIPFLHVLADNTNAIKLYKDLGFIIRTGILIYLIKKINRR